MFNGIGHHQILAVGAEAAPLCQKLLKPLVSLCIVGRSGVHDAQTVALNLLRAQSLLVKNAVLVCIAGQISCLCQRIHRIGHNGEQALKVFLPGLAGVLGHDLGIILKLIHSHILDLRTYRRNSLGGHEYEHIALEQLLRLHHVYLWKRVVVPGIGDLVFLKFPAGRHLVGDIADSDGAYHISS